ncbi:MAG TPA: 50S ribosomal protein L29 [Gammaproteobacteria bacterium]|nr:50S ribosomal protein L29 [Gammaproteobacteria bacterium]
MIAKQLRQKELPELNEELKKLIQEGFKLKMRHGSGQLNQNHLLKNNRKAIAQIKTVIHERERG